MFSQCTEATLQETRGEDWPMCHAGLKPMSFLQSQGGACYRNRRKTSKLGKMKHVEEVDACGNSTHAWRGEESGG